MTAVLGTSAPAPLLDVHEGPTGWGGRPYRLTPQLIALRVLALAPVAYLVLYFPLSSEDHADLATRAAIFAIIGLSLNVLIGYTGQLSLGHQGLVGIGAFATGYALTERHVPFALTFVIAIGVTALAALLLGLVALRVQGLYLALITLVFGATAESSLFQFSWLTNGGAGQPAPRPDFLLTNVRFYVFCLVWVAIVVYLDYRLTKSKTGRALLALKENERVAGAFGINVTSYKLIAFTFTGAITGLAGALFAYKSQAVNGGDFNFFLALTFVLMAVVGGLGSRLGVVIGSAFFAVVNEVLSAPDNPIGSTIDSVFGTASQYVPSVIGALLLLLTLIFNPGGIAQQIRPITRWLGGKPFSLHGEGESGPGSVEGSSVRA